MHDEIAEMAGQVRTELHDLSTDLNDRRQHLPQGIESPQASTNAVARSQQSRRPPVHAADGCRDCAPT